MRGFSKILIICALLFSVHGLFIQPAFADAKLLAQIETQIGPESTNQSIIKLQKLFQQLGLYDGKIDGKYASIEQDILDYQIKKNIIVNKDSYGAGYFGKKTVNALKVDFPNKFQTLAKQTLKREAPTQGERKFVVTAYYSPLPGQSKYVTGSYNGDIKLNGNGTHGASGEAVHPGFLAAPKNYSYGTKIYFEGLGVGVVEDRGGAIVNAGSRGHSYDRIDIWMGYGDEGRNRAIKWGKRTVSGAVLSKDSAVTISFGNSPVNKYNGLKVDAENPKPANVKKLQELFKEIGKYNGAIDGEFDDIKDILIDFQVKKRIISSRNSPEAGYFGPKTLSVLREEFEKGIEYSVPQMSTKKIEKQTPIQISIPKLSSKQKSALDAIVVKIENYLKKKSKGDIQVYNTLNDKIKDRIEDLMLKQSKSIKKLQLEYIASNL